MSELNLRDRIRAIRDDTGEVDPGVLVEKVLDELTDAELRAAVRQTLRDLVSHVVGEDRPFRAYRPPAPGRGRHPGRAVRDALQLALDAGMHVDGQWKKLRHCGTADLLFCEAERRDQATELVRHADGYAALVAALAKHRKKTVDELPEAVQRALLLGGGS